MKNKNLLKQKLSNGSTVFGTWSSLGSTAAMNCIAQTGMDFIITDREHGSMSLETIEAQLYYTENTDCSLIVRISRSTKPPITNWIATNKIKPKPTYAIHKCF